MTIKIISLNLWLGGKLLPSIIDFLRTENADVLSLQEVYNSQDPASENRYRSILSLQGHLPYPYSNFAQSFIHDGPAGKIPQGNAVLSRFPLTAKPGRFLLEATRDYYQDEPDQWPIIPRMLQHVELHTPGADVQLFNMHGVWDIEGSKYTPARRYMHDVIIEELKKQSGEHIILTGDTNAQPTNRAMHDIENYLDPAFDSSLTTTFNMRRKDKPGYATAAVDLMYVSRNIKVASWSCPDVDISDHRPLVVELNL